MPVKYDYASDVSLYDVRSVVSDALYKFTPAEIANEIARAFYEVSGEIEDAALRDSVDDYKSEEMLDQAAFYNDAGGQIEEIAEAGSFASQTPPDDVL